MEMIYTFNGNILSLSDSNGIGSPSSHIRVQCGNDMTSTLAESNRWHQLSVCTACDSLGCLTSAAETGRLRHLVVRVNTFYWSTSDELSNVWTKTDSEI